MNSRTWLTSLVLAACSPLASSTDGPRDEAAAATKPGHDVERADPPPGSRPALELLATIAVREQGPSSGYGREQYGPVWADADRNGCDTRDDVLRRDLSGVHIKPGTHDCVVLSGTLTDPYTGTQIRFDRGGASDVDIDHVVALENSWVTGAAQWPFRRRVALANDPLNLLAAAASANRSKSAGDAATWLPANEGFRCGYVARQIAVKAKYGLWITATEHAAWVAVLRGCPDQLAPVGDAPTLAPIDPPEPPRHGSGPRTGRQTGTARSEAPPAPETRVRSTDPNYGTCKQVKANHAGPYVRGRDPEYAYYDDRDGDGVVCE